jgi:hypothetical protein
MTNTKFYVGQQIKNAPEDDFPYFEIVSITESLSGLKFYRVKSIFSGDELVLHEEDLYPYEETVKNEFEEKIKNGGYTKIIRIAENILLRPNDTRLLFGEERFNKLVEAVERILENYKNDEIYNYYYGLQKVNHGFCDFKRWKRGLLF